MLHSIEVGRFRSSDEGHGGAQLLLYVMWCDDRVVRCAWSVLYVVGYLSYSMLENQKATNGVGCMVVMVKSVVVFSSDP